MRILISLISDYLQPNFLLIKEFEGEYDQLVFLTTVAMEEKWKRLFLERALGIEKGSTKNIIVVEDNYEYIISKLKEQNFSKDDEYILNITGGTKLMSIAVYEFFKQLKSSFYYVPIGKNVIMDLNANAIRVLKYRMNLQEYLTINSLYYESDNNFIFPRNIAIDTFEKIRKNNFNLIYKIKNAQRLPTPEEKRYYGGAWFEDYTYFRILEEFKLNKDAIGRSVKIYRKASDNKEKDNEIDVAFVKDNTLSIIECKVSMFGRSQPKDTIEEYLYKLAAIAKDLGMRVNSYLFTLHKIEALPIPTIENIKKRMSILGINDIVNGTTLAKRKLMLK